MTIQDIPKVDCHCHVFDPDRFPYDPASPYHPAGQEIGTAAQLKNVFAAYGVQHALLVQPNSGYEFDNACMLDAIAHSDGKWKGIAIAEADTSLDQLAELKAQGIVGIAANVTFYDKGYYKEFGPLFDRIAQQDMFLQVQVAGDLLMDIVPMLNDTGARLLFDHCGRPDTAAGLSQPAFQQLLKFGETKRAAIKLSGYAKFAALPHPFDDASPYINALINAFGTDNCLWGSDWPFLRATSRVDYGPLLDVFARFVSDPTAQRKILWDNPKRLFSFESV
ncbi:2-pyrone-4,6-dicarboxylate hydrolase [Marivivens niveibacter]|uniref:2-pyrone-4,6-dicarboxylate hydrolase n=1 Tax=Marivivens niveibacter TaxID=1930667 RepID=A0A251WY01_9RHOB|nr:amidohydrolase family protein [Marivivens niveibacter]OUD09369.1 2-pyrone-4,6-dicarboxylate hydrolase [Marivivens niveibacter]